MQGSESHNLAPDTAEKNQVPNGETAKRALGEDLPLLLVYTVQRYESISRYSQGCECGYKKGSAACWHSGNPPAPPRHMRIERIRVGKGEGKRAHLQASTADAELDAIFRLQAILAAQNCSAVIVSHCKMKSIVITGE